MAIYHCSLRTFSRAEKHSAVAAAAYRAGALLKDERTGKTHRYENRKGVQSSFIILPKTIHGDFSNRAVLWNAAEASETRANSRVARELVLALPHELSETDRKDLAAEMAQYLVQRYRVAVDVAIHIPYQGDGHDRRNFHAHLLFTTRELTQEGFGAKTRVLDDKAQGPKEIEQIREVWEVLANDALKRAGFEDIQIDRRTLEEQGVDRIPQTHIGPKSKASDNPNNGDTDEEGDQGSDEAQGKSGGGGGSASGKGSAGDGFPPKIVSKRDEERKRDVPYKAIDQGRRRVDFVQEIKGLNERRAAFSDIPLKDQIADLERLTQKLDARVLRLEALETKTTLAERFKTVINTLVKYSHALVTGREQGRMAVKLNESERQARAERQKTHYGRTYRTGLHERIQTMRAQLDHLEKLTASHKAYKRFVDHIEVEVHKQLEQAPKLDKSQPEKSETGQSVTKPSRILTPAEFEVKLSLKAALVRENIPPEFQPKPLPQENALKVKSEEGWVDQSKFETPKIAKIFTFENNKIEADSQVKNYLKGEAPTAQIPSAFKTEFGKMASATREEKRAEPPMHKQPITLEIAALKKALSEKPEVPSKPAHPYRQPIKLEIKALRESLEQSMREARKTERAARDPEPKASTLKGRFAFSEKPAAGKTTNPELHREKILAEAEAKRVHVPPQFRPGRTNSSQPGSTAATFKASAFQKGAKEQASNSRFYDESEESPIFEAAELNPGE